MVFNMEKKFLNTIIVLEWKNKRLSRCLFSKIVHFIILVSKIEF